jgi:hypothetical protein
MLDLYIFDRLAGKGWFALKVFLELPATILSVSGVCFKISHCGTYEDKTMSNSRGDENTSDGLLKTWLLSVCLPPLTSVIEGSTPRKLEQHPFRTEFPC